MALATTAIAASLAITRARWDAGDRKLALAGTAAAKATVTLTNAATGAALGTARAEDDGRWRLTLERVSAVPCRVRATQGGASVERAVDSAPANCAGGYHQVADVARHHRTGDRGRERHGQLRRDRQVQRRVVPGGDDDRHVV